MKIEIVFGIVLLLVPFIYVLSNLPVTGIETNLDLEQQLSDAYQEGYHKAVQDLEFIHNHH